MATATRSKASTTEPNTVATIGRELAKARTKHGQATAAAAAALAHAADLDTRLREGDESVQSADLLSADVEVRRTAALSAHAAEHLAEREGAHAVAVAVAVAADMASAGDFDLSELEAQTRATITAALDRLRAEIERRNSELDKAIATAKGAGLVTGTCDPMSPVVVVPRSHQTGPEALFVNGVRTVPVNVTIAVASVLAAVAA